MDSYSEDAYFDSLREMFITKGWKNFLEGIKNDIDHLNNIGSVSTVEDLYFRKGQLDILNGIYNLETTVKTQEDILDESLD